jgi:serine protease
MNKLNVLVLCALLLNLSISTSNAQSRPEISDNEFFLSPKDLAARPITENVTAKNAKEKAVTDVPVTLNEQQLTSISKAAGIYSESSSQSSCTPGTLCKSTSQPETNLSKVGAIGVSTVYRVGTGDAATVQAVVDAINSKTEFIATPNYIRQHYQTTVTDPKVPAQWALYSRSEAKGGANFFNAFKQTQGSNKIRVAVLDTGVLTNHPDLRGALLSGIDLVAGFGTNDGDGIDLDPSDPGDYCQAKAKRSSWHGTHVTGIIAQQLNGVYGLGGAPNVSIVPIRVLGQCGGSDKDILNGMIWAMGIPIAGLPTNPNPVQIINMSLGMVSDCPIGYQQVINEANRRNVTIVVAAGNENIPSEKVAPAGCPGVIAVGAHDREGKRASFSNYGNSVTISAPGVKIGSTVDAGLFSPVGASWIELEGTSMAAPYVSAAIALLKSVKPELTNQEIVANLRASAASFSVTSGCASGEQYFGRCGAGMLDAAKLIEVSTKSQPTPSPTPTPTLPVDEGSGCFIATAAYGTYQEPEVKILRNFRDEILLNTTIGRSLVETYYTYSPPVADFIRDKPVLKTVVRVALTPIIALLRFLL